MNGVVANFLKKVFDIRQGEVLRASLMQLNIFLIISTLLIVKPTVNGLFLTEMGIEALPLAFVLVAVFAVLISTLYARFLGKASLQKIILITLSTSVGLFILFGILLRLQVVGGWILYAFYIWVAIFGVLTASQFWILANVVFNAREAKRLFGFIGAGAIAGGIFGGYLTSLLAESIGSENLVFVGAGLLSLCIPISRYIWKKNVIGTLSKYQRRKRIAKSNHPFTLVRRSSHLTYLASIIGLSVIVAKLVEYQFNAIVSAQIDDPDELTAFFGFWFSTFNVLSLAVQLLLTRRVVGKLGVGGSLFFLPISIFVGAVWIFFIPELVAAIFIKMSEASLKQSINKAAVELLALPIPSEIKNQTKTFIDVVVDSIATGIGGLILIFFVNGLELSTHMISIIIVVLVGTWLFFVWKIRKSYLQSFRLNVQKVHESDIEVLDLKNESVVSGLKKVLEIGEKAEILEVLDKLKAQPDSRFAEDFRLLLQHPSDKVKEESIRNLYFIKSPTFTEEILPFANHPSQYVKIAAFDYLIARSPEHSLSLMEKYLHDENYKIRWAALVSLAEESRDNPVLKESFGLEKRLRAAHEELATIEDAAHRHFQKIGLLKALGMSRIPELFPLISSFFNDENQIIARQATAAAGMTLDPYFLPALFRLLAKPSTSEKARDALINYGKEVLGELSKYAQSPEARTRSVQMIPSIVEHFDVQPAADLLFQLFRHKNAPIRLAALRSLNQMKIKFPYLNYYGKKLPEFLLQEARLYQDTLSALYVQRLASPQDLTDEETLSIQTKRQDLVNLLELRLDANLERIFRLLGLKYSPEDILFAFEGIQSQQEDLRINALEYLDNLLDPGLKKVLIPLIETALLDSISEDAILQLNVKIPDEMACYQMLLKGEDEEVKRAVEGLLEKIK
jgi:AAA family ATP:ADP antiporter